MLRKTAAGQLETDLVPEFRVVRALWGSGVPVARALWIDVEGRWLERPSFIMEKVPGATDFLALLKPEMAASSRAIAQQLAAIAAALHAVDWKKLGVDFLPAPTPQTAAAQQISYWESLFLKHRMEPHPVMVAAFIWLKEHSRSPAQSASCTEISAWGIFSIKETASTRCWTGRWCILGTRSKTSRGRIARCGARRRFFTLDEFVERYTELSGIPVDPEALLFYRLLSEVKHSIISLTGARSFMDGRTRNLFLADRASTISTYLKQFLDWLPK